MTRNRWCIWLKKVVNFPTHCHYNPLMNIRPPINTLCCTHSSFKAVWANFGQEASQVVSTGLLRSFVAPSSIYWSLFSAIIYAYWPRCGLLVSPTWFLKVYQFKVSFLGGAPSTKRGGCCDFMSSPFSTALTGQSKEFMGGMDLQPLMNTTRGTERGEICIWNLIEDQRLLQIIQPQVSKSNISSLKASKSGGNSWPLPNHLGWSETIRWGGDGCGCEMSGWSARSLSSCTSVTGSQWRAVSASQRPQGGAYNGSAATKRSALLRSQGSSLMLGFPARQADTPFAINISDWLDRIVQGNCQIWGTKKPLSPYVTL